MKNLLVLAAVVAALASACGSSSDDSADAASAETTDSATTDSATTGVRLVSADAGAEIQAHPPEDLVILDVRTPEEFAEGHLEGAVMIDFYDVDFAEQLSELDREVPYLVYCRSGNRSGQAAVIFKDLEFQDVSEVDGGILAWGEADLPVITE